jgi:hypothetical protein
VKTQCIAEQIEFQDAGSRRVVANFDAGHVTSDAGALLLREYDQLHGISERFAQCFEDHRDPERIEFTVAELLAQRVTGIALGYEDLNDHDTLRHDPLLAVCAGRQDVTGADRARERDRDAPLAGKSTLNRLEVSAERGGETKRYHKITADFRKIDALLVDLFLESFSGPPAEIVLDFDTTDVKLHGDQEDKFFHGYYDEYCYTPLYVLCGHRLLAVELFSAQHDAVVPAYNVLKELIARIRARWPHVRIIVRGDSGFGDSLLMSLCEREGLGYVFGLQGNKRLDARIQSERAQARRAFMDTGKAARVFAEFLYKPVKTWDFERRVVAKAEHLKDGPNPRFVVTNLDAEEYDPRTLYEDLYCARGNMENRIKEQQLDLFADRCSSHWFRSNTLRLYEHAMAYVMVSGIRREALAGTPMEKSTCATIRLRLFKIGALVSVTVRNVWVRMSSACPWQDLFQRALAALRAQPPRPHPA